MRCFRQSLRAHSPTLEVLESRQLLAATPQLLADLNTQESGAPANFIEFQGRLFYQAGDQQHGSELWSSDGTPAGTQLVKDLNPGLADSYPSDFVVQGEHLYFKTLTQLWRTDGTEAGTQMLRSGLGVSDQIVAFNDVIYFTVTSNSGPDLWKSDGTPVGTVLVKDLPALTSANASELVVVDDRLFFVANNTSQATLWSSDGTTQGTSAVTNVSLGAVPYPQTLMTAFGGALYFRANDADSTNSLWKSDGTAAGTVELDIAEQNLLASADSLTVVGDRFYFAGHSAASGTELWVSDGTAAGTQPVADLAPGAESFSPSNLYAIDDTLYFTGIRDGVRELWKLNAGDDAPLRLASLEKNGLSLDVRAMAEYQGQLYFTTFSDVFGADLWRSNGTVAGTAPWRSQIATAGDSWVSGMETAAGRLFFTANIGGTGLELWSTDGTYGSTGLLADLDKTTSDSSQPGDFVTAGDFVYFTANDGSGRHLFSTPGPNGPVTRLTASAYETQGADVEQLVPVGSELYFVARDILGRRYLGRTSGMAQTTQRLDWPFSANQVDIVGLQQFTGGVIFVAHDRTLGLLVCRADENGIQVVSVVGAGWSLPTAPESVVGQGVYYFVARSAANENELWRSNGTEAGTWRVRDAVPAIAHNPTELTATESAVYFNSADEDPALWKTDGTPAGTLKIEDADVPTKLYAAGDKLYFVSLPPDAIGLLNVTDGTPEGTQTLSPIGRFGSRGDQAAALDGSLYFFNMVLGRATLTKTDGSPQGTVAIQTVPGLPSGIATIGGRLYFVSVGTLYESDGTADGTRIVNRQENNTPSFFTGVDPLARQLTRLGETLYFSGATPSSTESADTEPYALTPEPGSIVGRHLFYNGSKFDQGPSGDDLSIATDKTAYLAGTGTATFDNISSYSRGINGVIIDFADRLFDGMLGFLSASDFRFRVGNQADPSSWTELETAPFVWTSLRSGDDGEFTRAYLTWPDGVIKNTWLEVTVRANVRTGLAVDDVFYFGSRIGDTGSGSAVAAITSAADELAARNSPAPNQPITSLLDFDRNGVVNAADALIARNNGGVLLKLNLPAALPAPLIAARLGDVDGDWDGVELAATTIVPAKTLATPGREELLACAARVWHEWLNSSIEDSDREASEIEDSDDDGLAGKLSSAGRPRR